MWSDLFFFVNRKITFSIRLNDFCFSIRPCRRQSHSLISITTHNTLSLRCYCTLWLCILVRRLNCYWFSCFSSLGAHMEIKTNKTRNNFCAKNGLQMYRFICSITFAIHFFFLRARSVLAIQPKYIHQWILLNYRYAYCIVEYAMHTIILLAICYECY